MTASILTLRNTSARAVVLPALLLLACSFASPAARALDTRAEFELIDTNDDGRVSSSEHEVYTRKLFDQMDTDGDYNLTRKEIMANESKFVRHVFTTGNILGPADLTTPEKIQRLDANQDGVISRTEHANGATAKFQKMDINNNGELTPEEFDAGG